MMSSLASNTLFPLRVLVVEDSPDILLLTKLELEGLGYSVLTASDAATALTIASGEHPDVLVSDLKMPGMDGYELIQKIRGIPELLSMPAIIVTGYGSTEDATDALAAGYDAHVVKPVDPQELSALIRKLTRVQKHESSPGKQKPKDKH